jgi:hypothetical protein
MSTTLALIIVAVVVLDLVALTVWRGRRRRARA